MYLESESKSGPVGARSCPWAICEVIGASAYEILLGRLLCACLCLLARFVAHLGDGVAVLVDSTVSVLSVALLVDRRGVRDWHERVGDEIWVGGSFLCLTLWFVEARM